MGYLGQILENDPVMANIGRKWPLEAKQRPLEAKQRPESKNFIKQKWLRIEFYTRKPL